MNTKKEISERELELKRKVFRRLREDIRERQQIVDDIKRMTEESWKKAEQEKGRFSFFS